MCLIHGWHYKHHNHVEYIGYILMSALRLYLAVWRTALVNATEYRVNFFTNTILTSLVAVCVGWYLWHAVYEQKAESIQLRAIPFSVMQAYIIAAVIFFRLSQPGRYERSASNEIRKGDLSKYLLKPIQHWWYVVSASMAERTAALVLVVGMVCVAIAIPAVYDTMQISFIGCVCAVPILLCAMMIRSCLSLAISYFAFWIDEVWTLHVIQDIAFVFLAGEWGPLSLLPEPFRTISSCLPFQFVSYVPAAMAVGMMSHEQMIFEIIKAVVWSALCFAFMRLLWHKGVKRFGAYGG
jgi:ABC-2 type transport system permease protein